jgi:hypothetical protein
LTSYKELDHWTFRPKSKIQRLYHVTLRKWLDHRTFEVKSKIHRSCQVFLINGLNIGDFWTKITDLQISVQIGVMHKKEHCVSLGLPPLFSLGEYKKLSKSFHLPYFKVNKRIYSMLKKNHQPTTGL